MGFTTCCTLTRASSFESVDWEFLLFRRIASYERFVCSHLQLRVCVYASRFSNTALRSAAHTTMKDFKMEAFLHGQCNHFLLQAKNTAFFLKIKPVSPPERFTSETERETFRTPHHDGSDFNKKAQLNVYKTGSARLIFEHHFFSITPASTIDPEHCHTCGTVGRFQDKRSLQKRARIPQCSCKPFQKWGKRFQIIQ